MTRTWKQGLIGACCVALGVACGAPEGAANDGQAQPRADGVQAALAALGRVEVVDQGAGGVPTFIRGSFGKVDTSFAGKGLRDTTAAGPALLPVLERVAPAFLLGADELRLRSVRSDDQGFLHARYDQTHNGLPVVGGELILHVNAAGEAYAVNGSARGAHEPQALTRVGPEVAQAAALAGSGTLSARGAPRSVYVLGDKGDLSLAYEVTVTGTREGEPVRDLVYVDATNGGVLQVRPQIHSTRNRQLYSANNQWVTPGTLRRPEGGGATGDAHIDMNYDHIGTTYACYETIFGRDSFDDHGAQITSTVHYGQGYVNAYWDGFQIVFGDGDNVNSGQLGRDLDVVAHEITHAVTQYESGLIYQSESGALNESLSDIAAAICENWARGNPLDADVWKIGEDIWTPGIGGDALRYMGNPTQDGSSKDYYPERYTGGSDNGGVHWNSGIPNLAFKLLVTGGTHPRGKTAVNVAGLGMNRAAQTFYFANSNYFTSTTTMSQARAWTIQAAQDRYDASVVNSVRNAWSAVGVP
ncbi:M4 family metallopeptidase [Pyxidicoccus caerfyrddinensis]|uniref:M4 family metallopeptidase n=1 Tax=Pyxidicoccus caerfyrddinensis TaxID=2709663 RepID=UPI001F07D50A|nr:M4 family metallopeptidase [Pyxidicoccus caerfyrddinensis]